MGKKMCILELIKEYVSLILSHFTLSTTEEGNSLLSFEFCIHNVDQQRWKGIIVFFLTLRGVPLLFESYVWSWLLIVNRYNHYHFSEKVFFQLHYDFLKWRNELKDICQMSFSHLSRWSSVFLWSLSELYSS